MAANSRDASGIIRDLVRQELVYFKHYWATVLNNEDELNKGRVQVSIPVLAWDTPANAPWAWPRDSRYKMVVPEKGDTVEVYFLEADPSRAVYLGQIRWLEDSLKGDYDGRVTRRILYDDPVTGDRLEYDTNAGELLFFSGSVKVFSHVDGALTFYEGTEALALGTTLKGFLDSLKTWADTHTHPTAPGGPVSAPTTPSPSVPTIESAEVFTN